MPYISGIEVLNTIKAQDPSIPVIILTGNIDPETAYEAGRFNADAFALKPPVIEDLLNTIDALLDRRRQELK